MPAPYSPLDWPAESFRGVNITSAPDQLRPGEVTSCQNITSNIAGQLSTRAGTTRVGPATGAGAAVHSVFYLSDKVSTYPTPLQLYVVGVANTIYGWTGVSTWFTLATGFSGNPLTAVVYRLSGTGQPWLIIGDSSKMVKIAYYNGAWTVFQLGITPPADVANATVNSQLILNITYQLGTGDAAVVVVERAQLLRIITP